MLKFARVAFCLVAATSGHFFLTSRPTGPEGSRGNGACGSDGPWSRSPFPSAAVTDGFTFDEFRRHYRARKPSLLVVYLKNGFIFGGYTSVGWNFSGSFVADPKSFLFRLSDGTSRQIVSIRQFQNAGYATYSTNDFLLWGYNDFLQWGCNFDLQVCFHEARLTSSQSSLGCTYKCPDGANPQTFLAGSLNNWAFQDIEVYQVL